MINKDGGGGRQFFYFMGVQLLSGGHRAHGNRDSLSFSPSLIITDHCQHVKFTLENKRQL